MNRKLVRISKFLSLVLRHKPERIGLSLDRGGWAKIDELLLKANQAGLSLHKDLLQWVVDSNDKHRFSFSQDRQRIRANYGHSIPVALDFAPSKPPEFLFHGTATRFVESIRKQGLVPNKIQNPSLCLTVYGLTVLAAAAMSAMACALSSGVWMLPAMAT